MLRARASNGAFILGIDATNVERLKKGHPILVSLAELGGTDDVLIMYGDSLQDIVNELEAASDEKLPKPMTITEARNTQ